jgi:hypothetical protein
MNAGNSPGTTENGLDDHAGNGVCRGIICGKEASMPLFARKTGWQEG